MALRLILVSLVASMGFELPSSQDMESWGRSGRVWVAARVAEVSTLSAWNEMIVPEDAPEVAAVDEPSAIVPEAPRSEPVDDLAFEVVVEGMASSFSEEIATARIEADRAEAALAQIAEVEGLQVAEIAPEDDEIAPEEDTLALAVEAPIVAEAASTPEPSVAPELEAPLPAPEVVVEESGPTRLDRLANAVRLTRSAVAAWASLIDPAGSAQVGQQIVLSR